MSIRDLVTDAINGASFISLVTETKPKVRKTLDTDDGRIPNPHFNSVTKRTEGLTVMVFTNQNSNGYDNMVRRRLEQEGKDPDSFELSERKWGTRVPSLPIVEHNGEDYLEVIVLNKGKTTYYVDGVETDVANIQGSTQPKKPEQGGLDDKVIVRTFKESSIEAITINKETHEL